MACGGNHACRDKRLKPGVRVIIRPSDGSEIDLCMQPALASDLIIIDMMSGRPHRTTNRRIIACCIAHKSDLTQSRTTWFLVCQTVKWTPN